MYIKSKEEIMSKSLILVTEQVPRENSGRILSREVL